MSKLVVNTLRTKFLYCLKGSTIPPPHTKMIKCGIFYLSIFFLYGLVITQSPRNVALKLLVVQG